MWRGTMEQYFELYEVTANYLKQKFPHLKIGGYASCGFYALNDQFEVKANSSPRTEYFVEFFKAFLDYISSPQHKAPLDFFSWHSYADVNSNKLYSSYVRTALDEHGFNQAESILNEWNPGIDRRGTEADACKIAEMMLALHDTPLDMLMYYDGQVHGDYQGLFNPINHSVFPAYFTIKSFGELYALENQVKLTTDSEFYAIAAEKNGCGKLFAVNTSDAPLEISLSVPSNWGLKHLAVLDGVNGLTEQPLESSDNVVIPPMKLAMLSFEKA